MEACFAHNVFENAVCAALDAKLMVKFSQWDTLCHAGTHSTRCKQKMLAWKCHDGYGKFFCMIMPIDVHLLRANAKLEC